MNLTLNYKIASNYRSNSQIAKVLTEDWVARNSYCPNCGTPHLTAFKNNQPVADFFCDTCSEEFELKSKKGVLSKTIVDGAYKTMIERINSENNPNLFYLTYTKELQVDNFLIIPKQFFTEDIIVRRPALSGSARRAGWIGCNIDISKVSEIGRVYLIRDSKVMNPKRVKIEFNKTLFLRGKKQEARGWLLDVMLCIDKIKSNQFALDDIYKFEEKLKTKHPGNNFIKDKIRQQLQMLRDKGIIEFTSRGCYKKIRHEKI